MKNVICAFSPILLIKVDHGKSTLADRILELSGAIDKSMLNKVSMAGFLLFVDHGKSILADRILDLSIHKKCHLSKKSSFGVFNFQTFSTDSSTCVSTGTSNHP